MKVYHRFAYPAPLNEGEEPRPFKTRDGAAFNELTADFPPLGFQYGSLIYNYPFSPRFAADPNPAADHIRDLPGFVARVLRPADKDEVSKFIAENLSEATRSMLSSVATARTLSEAQKQVLVDDLNDFVDGESLYTEARFKGVRLSARTQALRSHPFLGKKEVARLNRYLLEDAYPREFARIHELLRLGPESFDFLRADRDVLVLTTRPPLDDERHEDRKFVARSHSDLENAVFDGLRQCIQECARTRIQLSAPMTRHLDEKAIHKAGMRFRENKNALLVEFHPEGRVRPLPIPQEERLTAGFLVHLPRIDRYGCELIASFGMGGVETLVWNRIVRNHPQYQSWITKPVFVVAELNLKNLPPRPITLHFASQVEVRILLEHPLPKT